MIDHVVPQLCLTVTTSLKKNDAEVKQPDCAGGYQLTSRMYEAIHSGPTYTE